MRKLQALWIAVVCFSLLLPALAAADTAFSFRNGITWDTTVSQMMAAEGITEGDGTYNTGAYNGFTNYYLKAHNVYYVFRGDQLATAYALASDPYAATAAGLTALYGAPADVSADTVATLLNQLSPNSSFSDLTAWSLSDGTLAALLTVGGEAYVVYFNVQRITDGA
jgi:hypothetical protein